MSPINSGHNGSMPEDRETVALAAEPQDDAETETNDLNELWSLVMAEMAEEGEEEEEEDDEEDCDLPKMHPDLILISNGQTSLVKSKNDAKRMGLTISEWEMACHVKASFESSEEHSQDLANVSDYWYAQLAIAAGGDFGEALNMAMALQSYREEHTIRDTVQEGCHALKQLVELLPEMLLYFYFDENEGSYVLARDAAKVDTAAINASSRNYDAFMVGIYYLFHACTCDMASIRNRLHILVDCTNVGWNNKNDFKAFNKLFEVLCPFYPVKATARQYNTGVIFNLLFSSAKKALSTQARLDVESGYKTDNLLSDLFLRPTVEAANARLVASLQEALRTRYENEKSFSLLHPSR